MKIIVMCTVTKDCQGNVLTFEVVFFFISKRGHLCNICRFEKQAGTQPTTCFCFTVQKVLRKNYILRENPQKKMQENKFHNLWVLTLFCTSIPSHPVTAILMCLFPGAHRNKLNF